MNILRIGAAMLCGFATPAVAEEPIFSIESTAFCLEEAITQGERMDCIGHASMRCMESVENSFGNDVVNYCRDAELAFWDDRLNAIYQSQLQLAEPPMVEALRRLQRAWIPYRDARCDAVFQAWGEGTGRTPAYVTCLMRTTGAQAVFLEGGL